MGGHQSSPKGRFVPPPDEPVGPPTFGKARTTTVVVDRNFEDDYVLGPEIGKGTFAKVHTCWSRHDPTICRAVKIVRHSKLNDRMKKQLKDETRILTMLDHPNITTLYDVYRTPHDVFIVQEYCEGGQLLKRLTEKGRYSEEDARRIVKRMLDALAYAHSKGVVHRDLKPENVLLLNRNNDYEVKLADWGVSRRVVGAELMQTVCGTCPYMAPEVIDLAFDKDGSCGGYDERMDVWSIGVITYMLVAGFNPFQDYLMPKLIQKILAAEVEFPDKYFKGISQDAKDLILHLLDRDTDKRPTAAQALEHKWFQEPTRPKEVSVLPDAKSMEDVKGASTTSIATTVPDANSVCSDTLSATTMCSHCSEQTDPAVDECEVQGEHVVTHNVRVKA